MLGDSASVLTHCLKIQTILGIVEQHFFLADTAPATSTLGSWITE